MKRQSPKSRSMTAVRPHSNGRHPAKLSGRRLRRMIVRTTPPLVIQRHVQHIRLDLQDELVALMARNKANFFIETVRVRTALVRCQLD
jgi:hypothetical protein